LKKKKRGQKSRETDPLTQRSVHWNINVLVMGRYVKQRTLNHVNRKSVAM